MSRSRVIGERVIGAICGLLLAVIISGMIFAANDGDAWGALFLLGLALIPASCLVWMGTGPENCSD